MTTADDGDERRPPRPFAVNFPDDKTVAVRPDNGPSSPRRARSVSPRAAVPPKQAPRRRPSSLDDSARTPRKETPQRPREPRERTPVAERAPRRPRRRPVVLHHYHPSGPSDRDRNHGQQRHHQRDSDGCHCPPSHAGYVNVNINNKIGGDVIRRTERSPEQRRHRSPIGRMNHEDSGRNRQPTSRPRIVQDGHRRMQDRGNRVVRESQEEQPPRVAVHDSIRDRQSRQPRQKVRFA